MNSLVKVNFRSRPNRKAFDYIVGMGIFAYKRPKNTKKQGKTVFFGLFGKHGHDRVALANPRKSLGQ